MPLGRSSIQWIKAFQSSIQSSRWRISVNSNKLIHFTSVFLVPRTHYKCLSSKKKKKKIALSTRKYSFNHTMSKNFSVRYFFYEWGTIGFNNKYIKGTIILSYFTEHKSGIKYKPYTYYHRTIDFKNSLSVTLKTLVFTTDLMCKWGLLALLQASPLCK